MKECRYWVADDGTEFDNEEECIIYEDGLSFAKVKDDVTCFDYFMEKTDPMEDLGKISYLNLKTPEVVEWWKNYNERIGYDISGITTPGIYYYNNDAYQWDNLEEKARYYQNLVDFIKGA